jgi:F-type H+-transporting ATPase subunit b
MRWPTDARPAVRFVLSAAVAVVLASYASAAAAPAAEKEADHVAAVGHAIEKDGLSFLQLKRYDLGIYTLVAFGLMLWILNKFAWPKINEGLQKRELSIAGARDEAQKVLKDAEALRTTLKDDLQKAQDQVRAMLEEARRDADALRQKEKEAGVKDAQAERERAKREIDSAKDAALKEISQQAVDLAALMSAKAMGRQITTDDHRRLLDESLAELAHTAKPSA